VGIRPVLVNVVHQLGGDEFERLVPTDALPLAAAAIDRLPLPQALANERVFQPLRAINVLDEAGALLAAARVVIGQIAIDPRAIRRLFLADHDAVLDIAHPRATAGAVRRVGRTDDLVPLELVAVERLPAAVRVRLERVELAALEHARRTRLATASRQQG